MTTPRPRLVLAGTGGDAGKTLVSLALVLAWRRRGLAVAAFKKGPDYIDRAWLAWASGVITSYSIHYTKLYECARTSWA